MVRNVRLWSGLLFLFAVVVAAAYFWPSLSRLDKAKMAKPRSTPTLEQRVKILENSHDSILERVETIDNRLGAVDNRLGNLGTRMDRQFAVLDSRFSSLDARVQRRIARLQQRLQTRLQARRLRVSSVHIGQMTIQKVSVGTRRQDLWDVKPTQPSPH